MNAAYIHLTLNHFPLILAVAAAIVFVIALLWRSDSVGRVGAILLILAAVSCIPSYMSGDGAAHIVKGLEGVNAAAIAPHDEAATATLVILGLAAVGALVSLVVWRGGRPLPRWSLIVLLLATIVCSSTAGYTALLGGRIHHPETEIRK
ncbi:MAG: hypothetical protein JWN02_2719 [Acidobacteria bacterium]|nr:hypothetical protein [Acidobacteriota bacterium]